jgi:hypothetical protein
LVVSQFANGHEVWAAPFGPADRILKISDRTGREQSVRIGPAGFVKLVFEPTGDLLEAGVLANVPSLADRAIPQLSSSTLSSS